MENRINVAELLKDCPLGIELNCMMYNNVTFRYILTRSCYPIQIQTPEGTMQLSKYGCMSLNKDAKCVIFPKGKTTWEGFVPPCQFKDGDIVYIKTNAFEYIFIFKINKDDRFIKGHATLSDSSLYVDGHSICEADDVKEIRLATETERTKLFDAIKARGYYWDSDTKTLETLIKPKFKIGDKVRHKNNHNVVVTITNIEKDYYACGTNKAFWFTEQNDYELIHEPKFKVGDRIRKKGDKTATFTISDIGDLCYYCCEYVICNICYQDDYELVPNKFDINTLKPLQPVLVRDSNIGRWDITFYELYDSINKIYPYRTLGGCIYKQCIPYEENEYLLGKINDCNDFYKTWE